MQEISDHFDLLQEYDCQILILFLATSVVKTGHFSRRSVYAE